MSSFSTVGGVENAPFDNGWYFDSDGDAIVLKDNNGIERARFG